MMGHESSLVELGYLVAKAEAKARCEIKVDTGVDGTWCSVQFLGGGGYTMTGSTAHVVGKLRKYLST